MQPREAVAEYYASVIALDIDRWTACFSENATMILHDDRELKGKAELRAYESNVFAISPPKPTVIAIVAGDKSAASETEVRLPDGKVMRMAGIFQFDESGRINRLSLYRKIG